MTALLRTRTANDGGFPAEEPGIFRGVFLCPFSMISFLAC